MKPRNPLRALAPSVRAFALLVLAGLGSFGCLSTDGEPDPTQRPGWVDSLREEVRPVEAESFDAVGRQESPGAWEGGAAPIPRGKPKELVNPVARATSSGPRSQVAQPRAASGTAPAGTSQGEGENGVVVNVYAGEEGAEGESASASPQPLSALEQLYRGQYGLEAKRDLEQFGYDFFANIVEPGEAGAPPAGYMLGPGDEVLVTASGSFFEFQKATVSREGDIVIDKLGALPVAGRSLSEVRELVYNAYARTHKEFEVTVSLGRLRQIRVHVVGEAVHPGVVEISSRGTLLTALMAAGGPAKSGSLRGITIQRAGGERESIDLYRFLLQGEEVASILMLEGDVVVIHPIGPTVGVAGYTQRPAIYEVDRETNVGEVIQLAGGLTPFSFMPHVQIERTTDGRGRETLDVGLDDDGRATMLNDGDLVLIGAIDEKHQPVVQIQGQVVRPGSFQFRAGMTVQDLVMMADGLTVDAYLPQAFISRQIGATGPVEMIPERVVHESARRVLVVNLEAALRGESEANTKLMPLDLLTIRSRNQSTVRPTVKVTGAVKMPGTYELTPGLRVSELIAISGNLLPEAFYDEAELIRNLYDEKIGQLAAKRFRLDLGKALDLGGEHDPVLANGDQLIVRALRTSWITVEVDGQVRFPGAYVFPGDARITDLIAAAGGVLPDGDMRAAVFTRDSVRRLQVDRFKHLTETLQRRYEAKLERMVQVGQPNEGLAAKLALGQLEGLMRRMSAKDSTGRIVLPMLSPDFPASVSNLTLEEGDYLKIPKRQETVSVLGHIFNPGSFVAEEGLSVRDVVERSGGLTEYGDNERIYVVRADGNVQALHQKTRRLTWSAELYPGDVVLVPRAPIERTFGARLTDALMLLRLAAEDALLLSNVTDGDLDISWIARQEAAILDPSIIQPR